MKNNFESGLLLGGGLGASTVMFALALCEGFKLAMGLGAVAIIGGLAAIAAIKRPSVQRG